MTPSFEAQRISNTSSLTEENSLHRTDLPTNSTEINHMSKFQIRHQEEFIKAGETDQMSHRLERNA